MSMYSRGPWAIGFPPPNGEQTIGTDRGVMVAVATTGDGVPTKHNARLIASAPDLLEALEVLIPLVGKAVADDFFEKTVGGTNYASSVLQRAILVVENAKCA